MFLVTLTVRADGSFVGHGSNAVNSEVYRIAVGQLAEGVEPARLSFDEKFKGDRAVVGSAIRAAAMRLFSGVTG